MFYVMFEINYVLHLNLSHFLAQLVKYVSLKDVSDVWEFFSSPSVCWVS